MVTVGALTAGVLLAGLILTLRSAFFLRRPPGRRLVRLNRFSPAAIVTAVFVIAFGLSASVSLFVRMPIPRIHDELSYLLAADTFLHGRITNPPHPLWRSFETFHVLQQPTYMSKFPPAQGLALAFGRLISGRAITGVWITFAAAIAALAWMLLGWLPRRWAVVGALLTAVHPVVFDWSQSFWGGCIPLAGGALLLGGLRRLRSTARPLPALATVSGIVILALSRPYEGFAITAVSVAIFIWLTRNESARIRVALIGAVALGGTVALVCVGVWNQAVTGSVWVLPHALYQRQYAVVPYFLWQHARPAALAGMPRVMEEFHRGLEANAYLVQQGWIAILRGIGVKIAFLARTTASIPLTLPGIGSFSIWALAVPALGLPFVLRTDRWVRIMVGELVVFSAAVCLPYWLQAHYLGPAIPAAAFVWMQSLRALRVGFRRLRLGLVLSGLVVTLWCSSLLTTIWVQSLGFEKEWRPAFARVQIEQRLRALPGRDLVVVRYRPEHFLNFEWVYNEADIDAAEVVWARERGPEQNTRLVRYFSDRRIWLLDADADPPALHEVRIPQAHER